MLDADFLEHRAKLLDLAAFLDRVDRADEPAGNDPRLLALLDALAVVQDGRPRRAKRVLERWSDSTTAPLDAAPSTPVRGVPTSPPTTSSSH
ncbi:MAG: hypothetical protein AAGE65_15350 [Planctomycetota bacterium]